MEHNYSSKEQIIFPTDSPSTLLWQLNTIWQNKKKEAIQSVANLSYLQYMLLVNLQWLTSTGREITQVQLAEHMGMEKMNVSQALKILERDNCISRKQHSFDTRAKSVLLSSKGLEVTETISTKIAESEKQFFSILQPTNIEELKKHMATLIEQ